MSILEIRDNWISTFQFSCCVVRVLVDMDLKLLSKLCDITMVASSVLQK